MMNWLKDPTRTGLYVFLIILALLSAGVIFFTSSVEGAENPYNESEKDEKLISEMANGFINVTHREDNIWYECGEATIGKSNWYDRADLMARTLVIQMKKQRLNVSPWGVWGVIWNESRGNRCSLGSLPRKYAYKKGIIDEPLNPHLWSEELIVQTLEDDRWNNHLADLGLCQVVWKKYARIPDKNGERIPTIKEMLSIEDGIKVCVHGMKYRQAWARKGKIKAILGYDSPNKNLRKFWMSIPWAFWPGVKADMKYVKKIALIVQRMGGPGDEVMRGI